MSAHWLFFRYFAFFIRFLQSYGALSTFQLWCLFVPPSLRNGWLNFTKIVIRNLPYIGAFYDNHASRALQTHDLSEEGINFGLHTYFFDQKRTWRASPDEGSAQCRGHLRTLKTIHTIHPFIHSNKADMRRMTVMAKWYSGNHGV